MITAPCDSVTFELLVTYIPGLGFRALQAMSSASIRIMLLRREKEGREKGEEKRGVEDVIGLLLID